MLQAKKVHGWTLFAWLMRDGEEGAAKHMQHMWELFLDGTIQPLTGTELICSILQRLFCSPWDMTGDLNAGINQCLKVSC